MKHHVSFLIPAFNVESFLPKCVLSILSQKDPRCDYKIIIIDDKSEDSTFRVARELEAKHPNTVKAFQNPENKGPAYTLNRCWEKSQSKFQFILHSDNELIGGALSLLIDYIESEKYQEGIVFGDIEYIDSSDKVTGAWSGEHLGDAQLSNSHLIKNYIDKNGNSFRPLQFLIDRKTYERVGPYSEDYFLEDWEFSIRYLCNTDFHRISSPIVRFRNLPNSLGTKGDVYADSLMDVVELHEEALVRKSSINPKTLYTNTLCRVMLLFKICNKGEVALERFKFYKKKYGSKINSLEVLGYYIWYCAEFSLMRLLRCR